MDRTVWRRWTGPERTVLYRTLADLFERFLGVYEERFEPTHGYLRRSVERAVYRRLGVHFYEEAISYTRNDSMVLYNAACTFCAMNKKTEAFDALTKAWRAGAKDADWARRDPDLTILRGDPEFERLYPEKSEGS